MNDEYLWQKTGEDPETARLEELLTEFRYRESAPPPLPVTTVEVRSPRRWFSFAFAAAAFATVVIAAALWFAITRWNNQVDEVTFVHDPEPPANVENGIEPAPLQPSAPADTLAPPARQPVRRGRVNPQSAELTRPRRHATKNRSQEATVALTEQERYAYNRLMLALSITSSKLNDVRNTIDGIEKSDKNAGENQR